MAGITATILIDDVDDLGTDIDGLLDMAIDSGFVLSSRTEVVDGSAEVALGGLPTPEAVDLFARTYRGSLRDRPGVAELCAVLDGHPQCVVFAARLVDAEGLDPAALASELSGPDPCHQVAKRLLAALPESEARVAAFLAALEGAPVPVEQATAATAVSRTAEVLRELAGAGIAPSNSPRYAFNPMLQDAAEELWDLDELRVTAVDQLTGWLGQRSPEDPSVIETAPMVLHLMDWAAGTGRHHETVALGEGIDGALALSGHWGSWERVHEIVLGSASDAGDAAAQGWALHQMGTKALCWGERSAAESLLGEALTIRQEAGVQSAIDTTQHNLDVLHPPPAGVAGQGDTPPGGGGGGIPAIAKGLGIVHGAGAVAVGQQDRLGPDFVVAGEKHRAMHGVFELAHVAAPAVRDEKLQRRLRDRLRRHLVDLGVLLDEELGQGGDIVRPLAQRRDVQMENVEAEQEVLAKVTLGDLGAEVDQWLVAAGAEFADFVFKPMDHIAHPTCRRVSPEVIADRDLHWSQPHKHKFIGYRYSRNIPTRTIGPFHRSWTTRNAGAVSSILECITDTRELLKGSKVSRACAKVSPLLRSRTT